MSLRKERRRVTPSTFKDESGNWITLAAVDSTTLMPRAATPDEIEKAKNAKPEPDDGCVVCDSTTRISWKNIAPANPDLSREMLKEYVDSLNIAEGRKRDEEVRYANWREKELGPGEKRPAKSEAPSL